MAILLRKRITRQIDKKNIKKILIFEGGGIGDLLRIFPAIDVLIDNFPDAFISIVVAKTSKGALDLYPRRNFLFEIFDYDINGSHRGILKKLLLVFSLRKRRYDMIYVPTRGEGMREISLMAFLTGIPSRIGFKDNGAGSLNTVSIDFQRDVPILQQNLALLKRCNLSIKEKDIKIMIPKEDIAFAEELLAGVNSFPLTVIHPSASWQGKYRIWNIEKYIELINELLKEYKGTVILIGSKDEKEIGNKISSHVEETSLINMIGKTTIPQTAAIIKNSQLFIGNDSGPLHIALALKIPSTIAIFGPTSHLQVLSSGYRDTCIVVRKDLECTPCYVHQNNYVPSCKDIKCLDGITVSQLMNAAREIITRRQ